MLLLVYSLRSVLQRRATSIATVIGIAALVFTLGGTLMLLAGVHKSLDEKGDRKVAVVLGTGASSETESSMPMSVAQAIAAESKLPPDAHVEELVTLLDLPRRKGGRVTAAIRGFPKDAKAFRPNFEIVEGRMATPGAPEVVIGRRLKDRLADGEIGADIQFKQNLRAKVVGFFSDGGSMYESEMWLDRDVLQDAFDRQGFASSVRMRFDSPSQVESLRGVLESDRRYGVRVYAEPEFLKKQGSLAAGLVLVLGVSVSLLIALAAGLGVSMTMFGAVGQRRREIGVLRALGFKRGQILTTFLIEPVAFGVCAGAIGSAGASMLRFVDFSLLGEGGGELAFGFSVGAAPLLTASGIAIAICVVSGFIPAFRASQVPAVAALRGN